MVPISLPSGKVVFISFEESLNDNFLQDLIAKDEGYDIDDPFDNLVERIKDPESLPEILNVDKKELKLSKKFVEHEQKKKEKEKGKDMH